MDHIPNDESQAEKARRIQREKRPYDDPNSSKEESEPKLADPHALILAMESDASPSKCLTYLEEVICIDGLNTLDVNDETEEKLIEEYFDEKTWETLDPSSVKAARKEEVEFMRKYSLIDEVDDAEA